MRPGLAQVGRAIGSPSRAAMINLLFDGTPHTAGELADAAGVTSGTASQHFAVLVDAGIITVRQHGRHRRYQLTNRRVAHALEQLCGPETEPVTSLRLSREQRRVRAARTCYDHLAGQLGVGLAERFLDAGWVDPSFTTVTDTGIEALRFHFGISARLLDPHGARRPLVRACRDWTEQRDHLAGRLGALIAEVTLTRHWVLRKPRSRALRINPEGYDALERAGIHPSPR